MRPLLRSRRVSAPGSARARDLSKSLSPPAKARLAFGVDPRAWRSAEGPRPTAANGQPSPAWRRYCSRSAPPTPAALFEQSEADGLGISIQGGWFEDPRGPIALLLPAAAGVPVSSHR